eukprot:224588-Amphidinium_carterae.1
MERGEKKFDASLGFPGEGPFPAGRQREGKDLMVSVQPLTLRRYDTRVRALEDWLRAHGYPEVSELKADHALLLQGLKSYLQSLYESSKPVTWGTDLLAGLQYHHPDVLGRLGETWAMQRQWQRLQPGQFRVPMPLTVLLAFCVLAWHWAWYRISAALLLGYHLMLRPGELTNALRHHLVLPCDLGGDMSSGVLCIPHSKTSDRASRLQSVVIEDWLVLRIALAVFGKDHPRAPLVPGGMKAFLMKFQQLKTALGLETTAFNPSSLRGGGATEYIRRTGNLGYLQLRGRWLNPKSMHHYLQMGLAATAYASLDSEVQQLVQSLAAAAPHIILPDVDVMLGSVPAEEKEWWRSTTSVKGFETSRSCGTARLCTARVSDAHN